MTRSAPQPLHTDEFDALLTQTDGRIGIRMIGVADLNVRDMLETFLQEVHATAMAARLDRVDVDMRALEFINSSCLASLVHWIELRDNVTGPRYAICFIADKASSWQQRSLRILQGLSCELVAASR
jgi:hypothetical protein